ncbi:MAG TPA: VOC family protein [Bryobacteraceae bacterium]|jgi:catechol 2,3-dioxygenase-like lactoylglutathione lyase family enzyme|nr:VOC family protein [Bryobacteraceae bacterium]
MPEPFKLSEQALVSFVAARDPEAAKKFYRDVLGLRLVSEQLPYALVFDANGVTIRVSIVQSFTPATYTVLGWDVPDIQVAMKALEDAGVHFERYPGMPQDEMGIWTAPGGAKVAWFKDPDGNTLSISQH